MKQSVCRPPRATATFVLTNQSSSSSSTHACQQPPHSYWSEEIQYGSWRCQRGRWCHFRSNNMGFVRQNPFRIYPISPKPDFYCLSGHTRVVLNSIESFNMDEGEISLSTCPGATQPSQSWLQSDTESVNATERSQKCNPAESKTPAVAIIKSLCHTYRLLSFDHWSFIPPAATAGSVSEQTNRRPINTRSLWENFHLFLFSFSRCFICRIILIGNRFKRQIHSLLSFD